MLRAGNAGRGRLRTVLLGILISTAGFGAHEAQAAERYDPTLRFRTITTQHFAIHFHQGEQALARRLARVAEEVHEKLVPRLGSTRSGSKTHVILVDQDDVPNGWAMVFPYNVIQIRAAAPGVDESIGNTDDWLRMVFVHEYTHVLHLDRAGGLIGGLRNVFGRAPLLFPNVFLPQWQIEGIATWSESAFTGRGRIQSGDFRQIVTAAAAAGRFEPVDRVNGGLVDWPDGHGPYAYGGFFHEHLARRFGDRRLGDLADATGRRLPFLPLGAFNRAFGEDFGALWREFRTEIESHAAVDRRNRARRLTSHEYQVGAPRWSADGARIFYSLSTPHDFPALMSVVPGSQPERLSNRAGGTRTAATREAIIFDQLQYVRSVGLQGDLYQFDLASRRIRRLTTGARASDPDVSSDGKRIACIVEDGGTTALAVLNVDDPSGQPKVVARAPDTQFGVPRWAPDGRSIAAERRPLGGPFEIVVVDTDTGATEVVVGGPGRHADPEWTRDGRWILFASDRSGGPLDLHAVERLTRRVVRVTRIDGGAHAPSISPDGRSIAFIGYVPTGYEIFSTDLPDLDGLPALSPPQEAGAAEPASVTADVSPEKPYNPWSTLYPRYWTPVIEEDNGQIEAGAATTGADPLARHSYAAAVTWGSAAAHPDWQVVYAYDRWRPTFVVAASDDRSEFQQADYRDRTLDVGTFARFRRVLRLQTVSTSLHASEEVRDCAVEAGCVQPGRTAIDRRAVRGGWSFTTARSYGYSISPEDGFTVGGALEATREAFGSSGDATTITVQARGYPSFGLPHAVLATRAAFAGSWGDAVVARRFGIGGVSAETPGNFGRDAVGLLRGYDEDAAVGFHAAVVNVDFRLPLVVIERGSGRWPFFLKTLHAAGFVDAGHAWDRRVDLDDLKVTFGAELSMDTTVGFSLPLTFTAGVAWRHDGSGSLPEGAAVFGRIGRAF
jgi:dipeptidyl aminopeptidase/acylaminoacyl peptidase